MLAYFRNLHNINYTKDCVVIFLINFLIFEAVPIFHDNNDLPMSITFDGDFFHILTHDNNVVKIDLSSNIISKTSTNSYYASICYFDTKNIFLAVSKKCPNTIFLLDCENFSVQSKILIKHSFINIYDICVNKSENIIEICSDNSVFYIDFYGNVLNISSTLKFPNLCSCVHFNDTTIITAKTNLGVDLFLTAQKNSVFQVLSCLSEDYSVKSMTFYECEEKNKYIFCLVKYKNQSYKILKIKLCFL